MRLTFPPQHRSADSMTSPQIDLHKAFHNLSQLSQIDSFLNSANNIDLSKRNREEKEKQCGYNVVKLCLIKIPFQRHIIGKVISLSRINLFHLLPGVLSDIIPPYFSLRIIFKFMRKVRAKKFNSQKMSKITPKKV
jgi:hypothetical protein